MKKLLLLFTIVGLLITATPDVCPANKTQLQDVWLFDAYGYARAIELQRQFKVPLVVYFYADWCPYCHTLDTQYLPSMPVQEYLSRVVKVRINPEHGPAERDIAARFGVSGYPAFFVITSSSRSKISPFRRNAPNLTPAQFAMACRQGTGRTARAVLPSANPGSAMPGNKGAAIGRTTSRRGGVRITEVAPR